MDGIVVVGLDLAKNVFQVHGIGADGGVLVRRQLRRGQVLTFFTSLAPCLVGMEACASAHHWARELMTLGSACPTDATGPREGLCEAGQDRRPRCGGNR